MRSRWIMLVAVVMGGLLGQRHAGADEDALGSEPTVAALLSSFKNRAKDDEWADYRARAAIVGSGGVTSNPVPSSGGGTFTPRELSGPAKLMLGEDLKIKGKISVEDDRYTIDGRTFTCKKVVFNAVKADLPIESTVTLWLSTETKGFPVVCLKIVPQLSLGPIGTLAVRLELVGFGVGKTTEWGQRLADIQAEAARNR